MATRTDEQRGESPHESEIFSATADGACMRAWLRARQAVALIRFRPFDQSSEWGRSLERYRRIALTTATGALARAVAVIVGLVTVPLVMGYLGREQYGLWTTISTLVAWASLADLGLANGLVNCLSRANGLGDEDAAARYTTTTLAALAAVAVVMAVGFALVAGRLDWPALLAARGAAETATVTWSVVAAVIAFLAAMPLSTVPQMYAGYQKSYVANAFVIAGQLTGFAALIAVVGSRLEMPALILAVGLGPVAGSALAFVWAVRRSMPWLSPRLQHLSLPALRAVLDRSVPIFLYQVGALAVNESQSIILAHRRDLVTVTEYSVAIRLYLLAASVILLGTNSFLPSFREAAERGDTAWTSSAFRRFLAIRLGLAGAASVVLVVGGNALVRVWLRRDDIWFDGRVWAALGTLLVLSVWASAYAEILSIMDRLWPLVALGLANGAVTVVLTWELAPRLGVLGATLAMAAVPALLLSWALPLLARPLFTARGTAPRP